MDAVTKRLTIIGIILVILFFGGGFFILLSSSLDHTAEIWGWWSSSGKFNAGYDKDFNIVIKSRLFTTAHEFTNKNWSETKSILIYYHVKYGIGKIKTPYQGTAGVFGSAGIMEFDDYINAGDAEFPGCIPIQMTKAQLEPGQLPTPALPATPIPTPTHDYTAWYNQVVM